MEGESHTGRRNVWNPFVVFYRWQEIGDSASTERDLVPGWLQSVINDANFSMMLLSQASVCRDNSNRTHFKHQRSNNPDIRDRRTKG